MKIFSPKRTTVIKAFRLIFTNGIYIRVLCLSLAFLLIFSETYAQTLDLTGIRVEELSDDQLRKFVLDLDKSGASDEQFERIALQSGLNPVELVKLKNRIQSIRKQIKNSDEQNRSDLSDSKSKANLSQTDFSQVFSGLTGRNFGADVFNNPRISFEPNLNLPTPRNYLLGTNDELNIDISGISEAHYQIKVAPSGIIRIPVAGPISVGGLTIEAAQRAIYKKLSSTVYSSLKSGRTKLDVTIGNIRSIKVTVIGEATTPGTYTLPSLATAFNALYACGGPNKNGSYRNIQVIRNNKTISTIDIYKFLLSGDKSGDVHLRDEDIIRINAYSTRIELKGEIKKPAIYDQVEKESLNQIINYAGGFTENAYTAKIQVYRNSSKERLVATINEQDIPKTIPEKGDVFIIGRILNRFGNRISISGAVYRPGDYELKGKMTIRDLIEQADGLREDAFTSRGLVHRLKPDLSPQIIAFEVEKIIKGDAPDIELHKEDRVEIFSKFDLREGYYVKIDGEVSSPGTFLFEEGMTVADLIQLSGGLKESSSLKRVEISRRIKDTSGQVNADSKAALILQQDINANLNGDSSGADIRLDPFDEVVVRTSPGYFAQKNVVIEGEIVYTGKYTLEAKNDRISDLIKRAGGLTPSAYLPGAVLVRKRSFSRTEQANYEQGLKNLAKQSLTAGTSPAMVQAQITDIVQKYSDFVGIDLEKIVDNPKSEFDLFLNDGDTLRIPKQLQTVRVSGEVLYPTLVRYDTELRFKDYVLGAGGFADRSAKKRSYVVYPNGSVSGTKSFLFFKKYPKLSPGAEIFIPIKRERERLRNGEVITIGATLVSMLAILFSTLR